MADISSLTVHLRLIELATGLYLATANDKPMALFMVEELWDQYGLRE